MSDVKCRPASKKYVTPCPQCGSGYPTVVAQWVKGGGQKELVLCCTRCEIVGRVETKTDGP